LAVRGRKEQEAGGNGKMRSSMILHYIYDQTKEDEMQMKGGRREL